jgi:uncharacterized protein YndB with AHSA1/START domain
MSIIEPVVKELVVAASQERAFQVFTDGIHRWWPKEHHIGKSPLKRAVIEPKLGGRWYAICEDDTECDTGKVLVWDPPRRLVLSWQLTAAWQFDPNFLTEVEVKFIAQGPKQTLVQFEHRKLEAYGESAPELRKSIAAQEGWGKVLDEFKKAAES